MDEKQVDRHYNLADLEKLYTLEKVDLTQRKIPLVPQDQLLARLLQRFPELVFKYHEHDSLLENNPDEGLSEEEKRDAWLAYEREAEMEKAQQSAQQPAPRMDNMLGINPFSGFNNYGGYMQQFPNYNMNPYNLPAPYNSQMQLYESLIRSQYLMSQQQAAHQSSNPRSHMGPPLALPDYPNMSNAISSLFQQNPVILDPKQQGKHLQQQTQQHKSISPDISPILSSVAKLSSSTNQAPAIQLPRSSPSSGMSISRTSPSINPGPSSRMSPAASGRPKPPQPAPAQSSIPVAHHNASNLQSRRPHHKTTFEKEFHQKIGALRNPPAIIEIPDDPGVRFEPSSSTSGDRAQAQKVSNIGIYNPKPTTTGISVHIPDNITVNKIAKMPAQTVSTTSSRPPIPSAVSIKNLRQPQQQVTQVIRGRRPQQQQQQPPPPSHMQNHPNLVPRLAAGSTSSVTIRPTSQLMATQTDMRRPQQQHQQRGPPLPASSSRQGITLTQVNKQQQQQQPHNMNRLNVVKMLPKQVQNSVTVTPVMPRQSGGQRQQQQHPVQIRQVSQTHPIQQRIREPPIPSQTIFSSGPPSKIVQKRK